MDKIRRVFLSKCASIWLVLLALAIVSHTNEVVASDTSSGCTSSFISDGYCDSGNNK